MVGKKIVLDNTLYYIWHNLCIPWIQQMFYMKDITNEITATQIQNCQRNGRP